jgi:hypothetical protein
VDQIVHRRIGMHPELSECQAGSCTGHLSTFLGCCSVTGFGAFGVVLCGFCCLLLGCCGRTNQQAALQHICGSWPPCAVSPQTHLKSLLNVFPVLLQLVYVWVLLASGCLYVGTISCQLNCLIIVCAEAVFSRGNRGLQPYHMVWDVHTTLARCMPVSWSWRVHHVSF